LLGEDLMDVSDSLHAYTKLVLAHKSFSQDLDGGGNMVITFMLCLHASIAIVQRRGAHGLSKAWMGVEAM
jgi:hypothetical protein